MVDISDKVCTPHECTHTYTCDKHTTALQTRLTDEVARLTAELAAMTRDRDSWVATSTQATETCKRLKTAETNHRNLAARIKDLRDRWAIVDPNTPCHDLWAELDHALRPTPTKD